MLEQETYSISLVGKKIEYYLNRKSNKLPTDEFRKIRKNLTRIIKIIFNECFVKPISINQYEINLSTNFSEKYSEDMPEAFDEFEVFLEALCRIKHYAFKEEREYRLMACDLTPKNKKLIKNTTGKNVKKIHFYNRNGTLIPYIKLFEKKPEGSSRLPIKGIIVGPHPEQLNRKYSVEKLLHELEMSDIPVTLSQIPFVKR